MSDIYNDTATPMLKQYREIKAKYPDSILFFRLGDFYEMFFEDAVLASSILGITLTSRNRKDPNPVPLCGVPYHAAEQYIAKLLTAGKKIAVCDQMEDPKFAKGIVKREVTRVITPGVVSCGLGLTADSNNFIAAYFSDCEGAGLALADFSTGFFKAASFSGPESALAELTKSAPREVLLNAVDKSVNSKFSLFSNNITVTSLQPSAFDTAHIADLTGSSDLSPHAARAAGALYGYLRETQMGNAGQIVSVGILDLKNIVRLSETTVRNLELTKTSRDNEREGSLCHAMDRTCTAFGARKLKNWILYPLRDPSEIDGRLSTVATLMREPSLLRELRIELSKIYDIERLTARAATAAANARDLNALKDSLLAASGIRSILNGSTGLLSLLSSDVDVCEDLVREISDTIQEEAPLSIRDGGMIKRGVSSDLDELTEIMAHGKDKIASIESSERESTGIASLKVRFNRVFGYYIEVTNSQLSKVPEGYIRKQTLANAERFITQELKEYEEKVLGAEDKVKAIEYEIFVRLREKAGAAAARLQKTADALASIDVLCSFATVASENNYVRPIVDSSNLIDIKGGRHPIVERLNPAERFVPNDVFMDCDSEQLILITGPNMAGKSTVMRQTAIIVLMAQVGSFVPAVEARIGAVDQIFTRVGASDLLAKGQSTFMVEMAEASSILKEATERSLIIIDEIGRGTSTFDGLSIAWAVAEHIHDRVGARTMFATHYHELTEIALTKPRVKNMQIAVKEWNGEVVFLRKLVSGATSRSYGIQVAKLAGMPTSLTERASEILANLESGELDEVGMPRIASQTAQKNGVAEIPSSQYQLFTAAPSEVSRILTELDTSVITPIEAINILHKLKQKL